jgi:hypothetical protein
MNSFLKFSFSHPYKSGFVHAELNTKMWHITNAMETFSSNAVVAHARICHKLKYRMVHQNNHSAPNTGTSPFQKRKNQRQERRKRRTNILLAMIASVFAISWFPLNILNILLDVSNGKLKALEENVSIAFVICHILVLSSACIRMYSFIFII